MELSIDDIQQDCEVYKGVTKELSSPELKVG